MTAPLAREAGTVTESLTVQAREVLATIMARDGLESQAEEVRAGHWDHTGYIEAMLQYAQTQRAAIVEEVEAVFKEHVIEQSQRVDTRPLTGESPGQWIQRTRLAAIRKLKEEG